MYVARLICSDERCAEEILAEARTLEELETLACDCGCGLELIAWPDHVTDEAGHDTADVDGVVEVVVIPLSARSPPSDLAA